MLTSIRTLEKHIEYHCSHMMFVIYKIHLGSLFLDPFGFNTKEHLKSIPFSLFKAIALR